MSSSIWNYHSNILPLDKGGQDIVQEENIDFPYPLSQFLHSHQCIVVPVLKTPTNISHKIDDGFRRIPLCTEPLNV